MIDLVVPWLLVGALAGLGVYGVLARRNAVMVLVGAELLLNAGVLLLVTTDLAARDGGDPLLSGQVGALFVVTIAAAEIGLALAVVLLLFRTRGTSDVRGAAIAGRDRPAVGGAAVNPSDAVVVLVLAPALAALVGLPLGRRSRRLAVGVAVTGALLSWVAALVLAAATWDGLREIAGIPLLGPVDTGTGETAGRIGLDLRVDALGGVVAVAVTTVALAVQVYSSGYLRPGHDDDDGDPAPTRYPAYAATVSLFTAAMLAVVQADDLFLLLIGWEVMGLCSYLLIGHHSERPAARRAAVQAFLVTRLGDVAFLLGLVVLYASAGTSRIGDVIDHVPHMSSGTATLAAVLLVVGVMGKSAQFPLHGWLPDAMEGPTPVSALIHAATMVAAGVVVLARFDVLLLRAPVALGLLAVVAVVTMLGAALAALVADDVKRVLAWSTVSQIAIMLAALALGTSAGRDAALAHLVAHAAFKSLLFLAAGALAHRVGSTALARLRASGRGTGSLGTAWVVGLLTLAALPPTAAFWSKEGVLTAAEHAVGEPGAAPSWVGLTVLVGVGLTSLLTGAYAGRLLAITMRAPYVAVPDEVPDEEEDDDFDLVSSLDPDYDPAFDDLPTERERVLALQAMARRAAPPEPEPEPEHVPGAMRATVAALGLVTVVVAALPLLDVAVLREVELELVTAVAGGVLAVVGLLVGAARGPGGSPDVADRVPVRARAVAAGGYGYQAAQDALVVRPVRALARLAAVLDRDVVEGYVQAPATASRWGAVALRRLQTGVVTTYLSWVAGAAVAVGLVAVLAGGRW